MNNFGDFEDFISQKEIMNAKNMLENSTDESR